MLAPPRSPDPQADRTAPASLPSAEEAWAGGLPDALSLPIALISQLRLSPEQFAELCDHNRDAVMELAADGSLILMSPTGSETGASNSTLNALLWQAVQRSGLPLKLFDSSTGFLLPDASVLSPDASLVSLECWQALRPGQRRGFAPLCPDVVVELASPSNEGPRGVSSLRRKMVAYQRNGARLGWLLIPEQRAVEVWGTEGEEPVRIEAAESLDGAPGFPGLRIALAEIWAG